MRAHLMPLSALSSLLLFGCVAEMSISEGTQDPNALTSDSADLIDDGALMSDGGSIDGEAGQGGAADLGGEAGQGGAAGGGPPVLVDPCEGVECGLGRCAISGRQAECLCDEGAQLQAGRCVDVCETMNCGPRGRCVNGACVCEGESQTDAEGRCVDPVDPCQGYDCGPLGACRVDAGAALCVCEANAILIGGRCVDPCEGFSCQGGVCRVVGDAPTCECPQGFFLDGDRCVDPCVGVDCGGGACVVGSCECFEGFLLQGGVCVDPCANARCAPGVCVVDNAGRPGCDCPADHQAEGLACVNLCDFVACAGGMECRVINGAPECRCPDGLEVLDDGSCGVPDPCGGVDCEGHGVCRVVNNQASCDCEEGYATSGAHCVESDNPCSGQTCSGHGECLDRDGTPVCACARGFTPSSRVGLDCVPTGEICRGGEINYDVDGDGANEDWFEPAEDECYMYELINLTRATHDNEGQPECFTPLNYNVLWSAHARNHSMLMRDQGGLFHADHPGGQNCASPSVPEQSMRMYMTGPSEPHCPDLSHHCNIMRCRFSAVGIGYVNGWNTQNFF